MKTTSKIQFLAIASLALLCSCVHTRNWYAAPSTPPALPAEVSFTNINGQAGRGGNLFVTVRLEDGEDVLFAVDTGMPVTLLDRSLESKLGRRVGNGVALLPYHGHRGDGGIYRAPKLYLGNTALRTGRWVMTDDLLSLAPGVPVRGLLGMDCLRHYCLQLDFMENKLRFLDPNVDAAKLGKAFPLTFSSGWIEATAHGNFFGLENSNSLIDTGDPWDGAAPSNVLEQVVQADKAAWARERWIESPMVRLQAGAFGGEAYPDLLVHPGFRNTIALGFLARHLVTFNFPKKTMYLSRRSVGP